MTVFKNPIPAGEAFCMMLGGGKIMRSNNGAFYRVIRDARRRCVVVQTHTRTSQGWVDSALFDGEYQEARHEEIERLNNDEDRLYM